MNAVLVSSFQVLISRTRSNPSTATPARRNQLAAWGAWTHILSHLVFHVHDGP